MKQHIKIRKYTNITKMSLKAGEGKAVRYRPGVVQRVPGS